MVKLSDEQYQAVLDSEKRLAKIASDLRADLAAARAELNAVKAEVERLRGYNEGLVARIPKQKAIGAAEWLPVAGLVRDEREVVMAGCIEHGRIYTTIMRAREASMWPEYSHYAELPAELPAKGGADASE